MDRQWKDWTENDIRFFREWKQRWTTPRDWTRASWESGDSSLIDWLNWIARPMISLDLIVLCMDVYERDNIRPTLRQVQRLYNDKCGRRRRVVAERGDDTGPGMSPDEVHELIRQRFPEIDDPPPEPGLLDGKAMAEAEQKDGG